MNTLMNNGFYWIGGLTVIILLLAIAAAGSAIVAIIKEKASERSPAKS
jgi:hypothetical protein